MYSNVLTGCLLEMLMKVVMPDNEFVAKITDDDQFQFMHLRIQVYSNSSQKMLG